MKNSSFENLSLTVSVLISIIISIPDEDFEILLNSVVLNKKNLIYVIFTMLIIIYLVL